MCLQCGWWMNQRAGLEMCFIGRRWPRWAQDSKHLQVQGCMRRSFRAISVGCLGVVLAEVLALAWIVLLGLIECPSQAMAWMEMFVRSL